MCPRPCPRWPHVSPRRSSTREWDPRPRLQQGGRHGGAAPCQPRLCPARPCSRQRMLPSIWSARPGRTAQPPFSRQQCLRGQQVSKEEKGIYPSQRLLAWRYLPNPAKAPRERQSGQGATLNARRLLLSGSSGARCYSCFSSFPPPPRVRRNRSSLRPFYCQVPFQNKVVTSHSVGSIFSDAGTDNQQVLSLSTARSTRL